MKTFKGNTDNIHKLIALSAALNFELRKAEEIRKEMSKLSLKVKKKLKRTKYINY